MAMGGRAVGWRLDLLSMPAMPGGLGGGSGSALGACALRGGGGGIPLACVGLGGMQRAKSLAQSEKARSTRKSMRSAFSRMGGGKGELRTLGLRPNDSGDGNAGGAGGVKALSAERFGGGGGVLGDSAMLGMFVPIISLSSCAKLWKYSSLSSDCLNEGKCGRGMLGGVPATDWPNPKDLPRGKASSDREADCAKSLAQSQKWSSASRWACFRSVFPGAAGSACGEGSAPSHAGRGSHGCFSKGLTPIFAVLTDSAIHWQEALASGRFTFKFTLPAYACQAHSPITITMAIEATEVPATMPTSDDATAIVGGVVDVTEDVTETVCVEVVLVVARGTGMKRPAYAPPSVVARHSTVVAV